MTEANIAGTRYGRLVVICRSGRKEYPCGATASLWMCQCDCGKMVEATTSSLRSGNTLSCGCLHRENIGALNRSHGMSGLRLYAVWKQMIKRCENPRSNVYRYYGALGVSVCKEWRHDFAAFKAWMDENGYSESSPRGKQTVDRIDPSKGYHPDNCRIISIQEQQRNKRRNLVEQSGCR